jgi:ketosteroid isomerase-like protein
VRRVADIEVLSELNTDVWHAFRRAYAAGDGAAFMALYTPDLIRAGGPDQSVYGFAEYAAQTTDWFAGLGASGDSIDIDFRFLERIASAGRASERGIYQITATHDGDQRVFYGKFHTFSRKTAGRWQIAVDYDSNEGGTITAASFAAASPIDDVAVFSG